MQDFISVPLSYEYLMSRLFGKWNYHGHVGTILKKYWKRDIRKINKFIKKAIQLNVHSDQIHKNRLLSSCDKLDERVKESKSIDGINVAVVEIYTTLIFLLLGNIPDHWNRRAPYPDRFWAVDGHRTLEYRQTDEQKTYLIINTVDIRKDITLEMNEFEDMHDAFYRGCKGNPGRFIKWFKSNYPKVYCELF